MKLKKFLKSMNADICHKQIKKFLKKLFLCNNVTEKALEIGYNRAINRKEEP